VTAVDVEEADLVVVSIAFMSCRFALPVGIIIETKILFQVPSSRSGNYF
jgi:hypothetical protein